MGKLKLMSAVMTILSVVTTLGLVKMVKAQVKPSQSIVVTIAPNPTGPPTVTPDSVDVYKSKDQQVVWFCRNGCNFTVNFPTSGAKPFSDSTFSNGHPKSGVPTGPPGKYPYTVKVGKGSTEPMIIVH